VSRMKLG